MIYRYEKTLGEYFGTYATITFGSGRMALYAILKALGIGCGDEVILQAYTCVVVPNAIIYNHAVPVYCDISSDIFNIDPTKIEALITPRTKAIILQHTFGQPGPIEAIQNLLLSYGSIHLIEDCCHAMGVKHENRYLGTFGTASFFSTDRHKMMSTGMGGFALTNNYELSRNIRRIQQEALPFPFWKGSFNDGMKLEKPWYYPCRMTTLQAYRGLKALPHLQENIRKRREIAQRYRDYTLGEGGYLRYAFTTEHQYTAEERIPPWFTSVVHGRNMNLEAVGYKAGSCPNAEYAAKYTINLRTT